MGASDAKFTDPLAVATGLPARTWPLATASGSV